MPDTNLFSSFDGNKYCTGVFLVFILDAFLALTVRCGQWCTVYENKIVKALVLRRLGLNCIHFLSY